MTDAHQSPLVLFPLKTTEEVDLGSAVRSLITNSYGEDPKKYSEQTSQLNRARQDAVKGAASDATGRDLLFKWFHMLEMLELRFPELRVPFPWKDAFTQKAISQSSLAYEKASIIFNIAATLSSLASSQARMSNPDGLKRTYTALRQAAGMLSYINENFLHAPSTDMSKDVVKCLVGITLAQASEVFLEKTIEEKKAPGLISKLASQTAAAYTGLVEDSREHVTKGIFERSWTYLVQVKARHFTSVMHYYKALADDASGSHGACLVRLTVAETAAKEARNLLTTFSSSATASASGDQPSLPSDAASALIAIVNAQLVRCTERKETAVKDNDLIYHDILPSESSLPAVDKLVAATPIAIQEIFAAPEVQRVIGPDLFQNLVPLGVHEKASLYSEEKAKIARAESERHDLATGEMQASLEYLGLPGSLKKFRALAQGSNGSGMLDSLSDPGAEVMRWSSEEAEGGGGRGVDGLGVGTAGVDSALGRIESMKSQAKEDIDAALAALDDENRECEKQRVRFGHKWTQDPAGLHTKDMRASLKDNREAMAQASQNDAQIGELWRSIREDVALLVSGREALEGAFAAALTGQTGLYGTSSTAPTSLIDISADEEQASESQTASVKAKLAQIDEALLKLNKIKKERGEVLADLKEKIQTDDISQVLVLNRRAQNVDASIFAAELEKFKPHQNRIAVSLHHQQALLAEVETTFKELSELPASKSAGAKWDEKEKARNRLVARLRRARDSNAQVRAGVAKGLQFYADLQEIVRGTRQNVNRYVGERKAERLKLVGELEWEEKGSGGGAGGLASSMAGLSMGGGAGGPPPPPPPGRQTSYGSAYGSTPLSPGPPTLPSLPGARQTSMPPAPLPHQQAPYQQPQQNDPYNSMFSTGPFMDNRSSPAPQQPPQQQRPYGQLGYGSDNHQPQRAGSGGLPPPPQQFQSSFSPTTTSPTQSRYTSPPPPAPAPQSFGQGGGYGAPPPPPQQTAYGYGGQDYGSNRAPASPYTAPPPPQQGQYGGGYASQPQYQQPYGAPPQQQPQGYGARAPPPPPTQYPQGYQQGGYQGGYQPPY